MLAGDFDSVSLRFVTLDPGTSGSGNPPFGTAIDGMRLAPVRLWVEAEALLMVISGGSGTLLGPVVGAALVVVMKNVASA